MNRLSIGRFIHELLENFEQLNYRKWLIYSGHDSTIVPMLCALDAYDGKLDYYLSINKPYLIFCIILNRQVSSLCFIHRDGDM